MKIYNSKQAFHFFPEELFRRIRWIRYDELIDKYVNWKIHFTEGRERPSNISVHAEVVTTHTQGEAQLFLKDLIEIILIWTLFPT